MPRLEESSIVKSRRALVNLLVLLVVLALLIGGRALASRVELGQEVFTAVVAVVVVLLAVGVGVQAARKHSSRIGAWNREWSDRGPEATPGDDDQPR
jgi:phosphotransferase system  glucose/maltose/N-acetylglucosamine-specific IIC component